MPLEVEGVIRSHGLKMIAFKALVVMTLIGFASCGGGGSGSGGGNLVMIMPPSSQGGPDLEVASPSVSKGNPVVGTAFTLSATVRNTGDGDSPTTTLRFYRSTDATITTSDIEVGTRSLAALSPSGAGAQSISQTAPSTAGTYYYGACVDAVAGESDTTNNCSEAVVVTVPVPGRPELTVASPSVSKSNPVVGTAFTFSATVRNDGSEESPATTLRYYRSTDSDVTTSDTAVGTDAVGVLGASGSSAQSISLTAPSTAGTYYYGACVDAVTDESDNTNNCSASVKVDVSVSSSSRPPQQQPDLAVVAFLPS